MFFSTVISPFHLSLIQDGQLSVTGEGIALVTFFTAKEV